MAAKCVWIDLSLISIVLCNVVRIVLSFDLNENINQDEGGEDVDHDDDEAFIGKVRAGNSIIYRVSMALEFW